MNIFKNIKKISYLEIILIILLFSLLFILLTQNPKENFVSNNKEFIRVTDQDIYDKFYSNIYDELLYDPNKNNFEIDIIFKKTNKNYNVLDVGCGTGHHVNLINDLNISVIGLDNSKYMIEKAKQNYPKCKFLVGCMLNSMLFPSNSFTHITCLYFTIYYIKNKKQFFENCFKWLEGGGILILHLVDIQQFDPILPNALYMKKSDISYKNSESFIEFDELNYKSDFQLDNNINSKDLPNATFKETFKYNNNNKTRINEHNLFMNSQKNILSIARELGFIMQSVQELKNIKYDYNYIYTLQKPY